MIRVITLCIVLLIAGCGNRKPQSVVPHNAATTSDGEHLSADTFTMRHEQAIRHKLAVDTTIICSVRLYPSLPSQYLKYHLWGDSWDSTLYWTEQFMAGDDTLLQDADSGWVDDYELVNAPSVTQHDSILSKKKRVFLSDMTQLVIDTVRTGDERRDFFKSQSVYMFRNYFSKMGYSEQQILGLYSAFWKYYTGKDILLIALQDPNPPGAESASAYDPTTKKVIPFYSP